MKVTIALCDDDKKAIPVIAGAVESTFQTYGIQVEIDKFSSGDALLRATEKVCYQLLLLDIEMPGLDGIAVGKRLRAKGDETIIVYISEAESRVFESFFVQPLGFVRKSNFLNDISAVVELYMKTTAKENKGDYLDFKTRSGILTLRSRQVRYIEGSRNYQYLYVDGRSEPIEIKMTMDRLEAMSEPFGFIRIHKGYLVNFQYIQHISSASATLQDGTELPIGRSKIGEVKMKYLSLIGK